MQRATRDSAVLLGVLALGVSVGVAPVFAEVQNVKVGGDITIRAFHRENLDLHQEDEVLGGVASTLDDEDDFLMSTTGINIGADLTENVSGFIRLANERDWDSTSTEASGDFDVSQAYITLKELFYSPLTLRIGTQPIVWGRGFVLGSALIPSVLAMGDDRNASISANEFTDFTAFDAIRATLDLSGIAGLGVPLTVDTVYIKLDENTIGTPDDLNLMGVNLGTRFDAMNSEAEFYYLNKRDKSPSTPAQPDDNEGSVNTFGLRGSAQPMEGCYVYGELAYQFGRRAADPSGAIDAGDSQQGWAVDLGAEHTFTEAAWTPKFGGEWIYYSGNEDDTGAVAGWDPIARGYFTTAIREFETATAGGFYGTDQAGDTAAATNQHQLALYGSLKPLEDLTASSRLTWFILDDGSIPVTGSKRRSFAGTEWDTQVVYNYTDDVQFGLIYALFNPGNVYRTAVSSTSGDSTAQELITSVSLKF